MTAVAQSVNGIRSAYPMKDGTISFSVMQTFQTKRNFC